MLKIKLNNMRFHSHIGFFAEEKILGQSLAIDLCVTLNADVTADNLDDTLSYAIFYQEVEEYIKESRVDLIETVAYDIWKRIKACNPDRIERVKVNVKKIGLPIDGILDSAEVEWEA